ncbi:zinc finger A20 and AN1 domain-containing stress-associated protein 4 [Euphorbia lathyris]|uniref:zinc finger A20 and AN1 domain-containing stress-associated protein 4 n=1 Tax=Euphorbia lathyris TaxID=212925 RepID=UPI003313E58C
MAEEHRCQAPEGHILCVNNCGFFGSPATMNLCSKCYRDFCLKERQQQQQEASIKASLSLPSSSSLPALINSPSPAPIVVLPEVRTAATEVCAADERPNRCFMCRKRVGLTGFRCRCGTTFCGTHRYPEKHNCTFDFRKVGREEIARANPLVVAEKLEKI